MSDDAGGTHRGGCARPAGGKLLHHVARNHYRRGGPALGGRGPSRVSEGRRGRWTPGSVLDRAGKPACIRLAEAFDAANTTRLQLTPQGFPDWSARNANYSDALDQLVEDFKQLPSPAGQEEKVSDIIDLSRGCEVIAHSSAQNLCLPPIQKSRSEAASPSEEVRLLRPQLKGRISLPPPAPLLGHGRPKCKDPSHGGRWWTSATAANAFD